MQAVYDLKSTFEELKPYLERYDIECDVLDDLIKYQMASVRDASGKNNIICLKYDFPTYFENIKNKNNQPLNLRKTTMKITPKRSFEDFETYAREVVWYGRRNEASSYKNNEIEIVFDK